MPKKQCTTINLRHHPYTKPTKILANSLGWIVLSNDLSYNSHFGIKSGISALDSIPYVDHLAYRSIALKHLTIISLDFPVIFENRAHISSTMLLTSSSKSRYLSPNVFPLQALVQWVLAKTIYEHCNNFFYI